LCAFGAFALKGFVPPAMPLSEFSLIDKFFAARKLSRPDVAVGIGDDAAVVDVLPGEQLVVAADTLVAAVHFPEATAPADIGHKALAVNLSDLAAMGARPAWATLALTLPAADEAWIAAFARGFFALAERTGVALIGGDTTRGPLTISVQILGLVPQGEALVRSGARPGDRIFVSGALGDAGLALRLLEQSGADASGCDPALVARLDRPEPRLELGAALRSLATAAIDLSDGLLADLGHILERSGVGATLWVDRLPRSAAFRETIKDAEMPGWYELPLAAGDDYELCFTVAAERADAVHRVAESLALPLTWIGEIESAPGLRCRHQDGRDFVPPSSGYEHFR